jgi:hypothetical protein
LKILRVFAVYPLAVLPLLGLAGGLLPRNSPFILPICAIWFILSFSYLGWLHGLEFFTFFKRNTWLALFKRSNWSAYFSKSNQDDPNEK